MKRTFVGLILLLSVFTVYSQTIVTLTGKVTTKSYPCPTGEEVCPTCLVLAIETDTATFYISKEDAWLCGSELELNDKTYQENDIITIRGIVEDQSELYSSTLYSVKIVETQSFATITGKLVLDGYPCTTRVTECPTCLVIALETDTATFYISKEADWICGAELEWNGETYSENDIITIRGIVEDQSELFSSTLYSVEILEIQSMATISGKLVLEDYRCAIGAEECPTCLVLAIETDTATFYISKDENWICGSELEIKGVKYQENSPITVRGLLADRSKEFGTQLHSVIIQDYNELVVEGRIWNNLSGGIVSGMGNCCMQTSIIEFVSAPESSSCTKKQVLQSDDNKLSWKNIGSIREDNKKVYFENNEGKEGLLYDFGASVGDIVKIVNYSNQKIQDTISIRIKSIDTTMYFNAPRQIFEVEDVLVGTTDYWMEGIGSISGLLNPGYNMLGAFRELLCVYDKDIMLHTKPERSSCYISTTGINENTSALVKIEANSEAKKVTISSSSQTESYYNVYSIMGQVIAQGICLSQTEIYLPQGVYIVGVSDGKQLLEQQKIIIQ